MKAKDIREKIRELLDEYGYPYEVERSFSNEKVSLIDVFSEDPTTGFKKVEYLKLLIDDYLNLASCVNDDIIAKGTISNPINEGDRKGNEMKFTIHKESIIIALCGIFDKIIDNVLEINYAPYWMSKEKFFTLRPNRDKDFSQIIEKLMDLKKFYNSVLYPNLDRNAGSGKIINHYYYNFYPDIFTDTTEKGYPSTKECSFLFDWLKLQGLVNVSEEGKTDGEVGSFKRKYIRNRINAYLTYLADHGQIDLSFELASGEDL